MKVNKISNTEYQVTFRTRPKGATNMIDDDTGKMVAGVESTHIFNISEVNPKEVDIPDGIMKPALSSFIINFQSYVRSSTPAKDFDALKIMLESNPQVIVSLAKEKVRKESGEEQVNRLKVKYPKITSNEIVDVLTKKITEIDLRNKYVEA